MRKLIANTLMILLPDDVTVIATIIITGPASTKVKAGSPRNFIYLDGTIVTVTAITVPSQGATIPDPGPYNVPLNADAEKVRSPKNGDFVLRVDDLSDTINATPQIPANPDPIDFPVSFKIEITDSGQTKVVSN